MRKRQQRLGALTLETPQARGVFEGEILALVRMYRRDFGPHPPAKRAVEGDRPVAPSRRAPSHRSGATMPPGRVGKVLP